jgi:hypothetical protein
MGYKKPRTTKHDDGYGETFTLDDIHDEPVWSSHYDEDLG